MNDFAQHNHSETQGFFILVNLKFSEAGWSDFFHKGADGKYFRLDGPYMVSAI